MRDQFWADFALGSLLTCGGLGAFALIIHWMVPSPRVTTPMTIMIDQRWPPLEKTDRLQLAAATVDAGTLQPPLGAERTPMATPPAPLEQAIERKQFDADVERSEKQYHRAAKKVLRDDDDDDDDRPRNVCERHGMHKRYFHTHHGRHLSWRCVGHYRR